uniref:Notch n=1 Tax=Ditylenchus dipsaci TaxID=166011 RepID=A0A915CMH4_9BILA
MEPCEYNPCLHGVCEVSNSTHKLQGIQCNCDAGWEGVLCDKYSRDHCALESSSSSSKHQHALTSPCLNEGVCVNRAEGFECMCPQGFTGVLCELSSRTIANGEDCRDNYCHNNGTCVKLVEEEKHKCHCMPGFAGPFCEYDVNECASKPCQNKGRCINLVNDFRCDCAPGYSGERCETNIDECKNVACFNGGTCVDGIDSFNCECTRGFVGQYCEKYVNVDKFNRTDLVERDNCHRHNCEDKANNGVCDAECNFYACYFDGGDCSTKTTNPFKRCAQPSYCAHVFGSGKCDEICNNENCLFDGFDCEHIPVPRCPHFGYCSQHYADGKCDAQCNITSCGWDGGDCDTSTTPSSDVHLNVLHGELSLILLMKEYKFIPLLRGFLITLSGHLRASIRLGIDDEGHPKVYKWRSDSGVGDLLQISELDKNAFNIVYDGSTARRSKRSVSPERAVLEGVQILLEIDVAMCHVLQHSSHGTFSCFSELESVAAFLGAANAKRSLDGVDVPIYSARVQKIENKSKGSFVYVLIACLVAVTLSVLLVAQVLHLTQKKKIKKSKVWIPPLASESKTKSKTPADRQRQHSPQQELSTSDGHQQSLQRPAPQQLAHSMDLHSSTHHHPSAYSPLPTTNTVGSYSSSSGVSSSGVSSAEHSPAQDEVCGTLLVLHEQAARIDIQEPVEPIFVGMTDVRGRTPLHCLLDGAHLNVTDEQINCNVNRLCMAGADVNAQDNEGSTPLIMAIKQGRIGVFYNLLAKDANVNLPDFEDKTPLYHAIAVLMFEAVEYLLRSRQDIDVNAVARRVETPLMRCAIIGPQAVKMAELLIQHGADVNKTGDKDYVGCDRRTALHIAASVNNLEMIQLLLDNNASKEATDVDGRTPLFLATANFHTKAVQLLLQSDADVKLRDILDKSPLTYAIENNFEEGKQVLEQQSHIKPLPTHPLSMLRDNAPKLKRPRNASKKTSVKDCKIKKSNSPPSYPALLTLNQLTPPNSDQSTYSTTPSPNNGYLSSNHLPPHAQSCHSQTSRLPQPMSSSVQQLVGVDKSGYYHPHPNPMSSGSNGTSSSNGSANGSSTSGSEFHAQWMSPSPDSNSTWFH